MNKLEVISNGNSCPSKFSSFWGTVTSRKSGERRMKLNLTIPEL
jgi:hypothetical protein